MALWTAALACGMEGRAAALAAALEVVMAPPAPPLAPPVTGGHPEQQNRTAVLYPIELLGSSQNQCAQMMTAAQALQPAQPTDSHEKHCQGINLWQVRMANWEAQLRPGVPSVPCTVAMLWRLLH